MLIMVKYFLAVSCLPQARDQYLLAKFSGAVYEHVAFSYDLENDAVFKASHT